MINANDSYVRKIIEEGLRTDDRKFDQFRKISIEKGVINKAEGSARVMIGNTMVLAGVKMSVGTPYPDTPNQEY